MLARLSIRNLLLIEALDLEFHSGLTALTGETGAGKSILLDALALSIGERARADLLRSGASQASVTAVWQLPANHPVWQSLVHQDLDLDSHEPLILRRNLRQAGQQSARQSGSKAFVNDQPVSLNLLRGLGQQLVEIQGQYAQHGLLDPRQHALLLDTALEPAEQPLLSGLSAAWDQLSRARRALAEMQARVAQLEAEREYLSHHSEALLTLAPELGEDEALAAQRTRLQQRDTVIEVLRKSLAQLSGDKGAEAQTYAVVRLLERLNERVGDRLVPVLGALDGALTQLSEASEFLRDQLYEEESDPQSIDAVEERLFALREAARRYQVSPDALPAVLADMQAQLATLDDASAALMQLEGETSAAETHYQQQAGAVSKARQRAAQRLEARTAEELPDLKLNKARLAVQLEALPDDKQGARGLERVEFHVQTNPDLPAGPLHKVASGGELSRFMLAMKVALSGAEKGLTLVFDEVDAGVGGATAAAVGQRLQRLAQQQQILVVTHSPQVAAASDQHWRVEKYETEGATRTAIQALSAEQRQEELARMLSGSNVTPEGREAARALLASARSAEQN